MLFESEAELEAYIRRLIAEHISSKNKEIYALNNKKAVDILICRGGSKPALFFLEVKYHQKSHGRLGFGSRGGGGFQPEIVSKKPAYFESNLRWVIASESHADVGILFVPSETIRKYVSGGKIGQKFNNIQKRIFSEVSGLSEKEFITELQSWLINT